LRVQADAACIAVAVAVAKIAAKKPRKNTTEKKRRKIKIAKERNEFLAWGAAMSHRDKAATAVDFSVGVCNCSSASVCWPLLAKWSTPLGSEPKKKQKKMGKKMGKNG